MGPALAHRLHALGTTFHQLVDKCRYEVPRQLLAVSDLDVAQVADALDYADASAFTRAFRRWSGTTPAPFLYHRTFSSDNAP